MTATEQFEVVAETLVSGDIPLGTANDVDEACRLIGSVDKSKYEPTEYRIRPVDDGLRADGGVDSAGIEHPLDAGTAVEYDHHSEHLGRGEIMDSGEADGELLYRIDDEGHPVPARIPAGSIEEVLD